MVSRQCAVSIVVPVLNDAAPLKRLLSSLQGMRNALWEIIVVDGGSTDESMAVAERFADTILTAATGRAQQMNAGAAQANGDLVWFVHADANVSADLLSALTRLSAEQENVRHGNFRQRGELFCWGRCDVRLDHSATIFRLIETLMNWRSRRTAIATGDQGIFVSRALFARINGYANIPLMEDVELCSRLRKEMAPLCLRNQIGVSSRRWTEHGIGKTIVLMWWLRLLYFLGASAARLHGYYYSSHNK